MNVRWTDPFKTTRERLFSTSLGRAFLWTYTAVGLLLIFAFRHSNAFVVIGSALLAEALLPPISVYVDRMARRAKK